MSEDEKEAEKPDKTLEIVKENFIFNRENQKQHGLSLKILTPKQMLSRLECFSTIKSSKQFWKT